LDPNGLLNKYDSANYEAGTLYFESTKTKAKLVPADQVTLYSVKKEKSTLTDLKGAITAAQTDDKSAYKTDVADATVAPGFYVWVPDTNTNGQGKYEPLDESNIGKYFDVTIAAADGAVTVALRSSAGALVGGDAFDGEVYKDTYTALSGDIYAEDYGKVAYDGDTSAWTLTQNSGVLFTDNNGTEAVVDSDYTVSAPEITHTAKSDAITITNKSTKNAKVTAKVEVTGIESLKFASSATLGTDDLYLSVTDGKNAKYAQVSEDDTETATAEYEVTLAKANNKTLTYQKSSTDPKTGSHDYGKYETPDTTYSSTSLYLTGAANKDGAWAKYLEDLEADDNASLKVTVTYDIKQVDTTATPISIETASKKAASGSALSFVFSDVPEDTTVTSIVSSAGNTVATARYTFDASTMTLKFDSTFTKNNYSSFPLEYTVTFSTDDEVTIKVTK
jgi:hypothetical protein